MELEEFALHLKTARRLIRQKKKQLNLIEFTVFDKSSSMDNFQELIRPATMTTRNLRSSFSSLGELYDDSNLNELLQKMQVKARRYSKRISTVITCETMRAVRGGQN